MSSQVPLPISFDDSDKSQKNKQHSRGIQVANKNITDHAFSAPRSMQKGGASQSQFGSELQQSNKPQFGSTKYPVQIITLELDDAPKQKQAAQIIVAVEPAIEVKADVADVRDTNDISSYAVKDQSPSQVLSGLAAVLVNYSQDMDIKIDEQNHCIEGVVFIENYYGIKFKWNIWSVDDKTTRFELVRTTGAAMAAAKFLGDIKTQFFIDVKEENDMIEKDKDNKEPTLNFVSLSLNTENLDLKELFAELSVQRVNDEDLKDDEDNISQKELDDVNESLVNNEMESIDELQFLHEKLKENGAISKDIIDHEQLVKTIIDGALENEDICVVRGCLLILEQLCTDNKIGLLLVEQYALFKELVKLLDHEYSLIKNYSVRLLAKLATQKKWNMDKNDANNIQKLVEKYQNQWKGSILANNGCIDQNMFKSIYGKLSECQ